MIGIIRALSKSPRDFTALEIELFEQLANGAAIAIENERLYKDLQKSNEIKSEFLGVMSHELRTPLNIIMGYAALLKDDLRREENSSHDRAITTIELQSNQLLKLFNALMEATKIESRSVAAARQPIDVGDFFQQLQLSYDCQKKNDNELIWRVADDLPSLTSDHEKLLHILQNLIDNAIKFTERGTVTISAQRVDNRQPSTVGHIFASQPTAAERFIEFTVADSGIGIPKENLASIFDIFKQADSSTTRAYQGLGLGLYIVKKYCELIGGEIRVESELGRGSTFSFALPMDQ